MIALRPATLDDLEAIHDTRGDAILGVQHPGIAPSGLKEWADRRSQDFFRDRLAFGLAVVAIAQGAVVGWGSWEGNRITALYVRPSAGSRGVGRRLMEWMEMKITTTGFACVTLESSPNAVDFYKHLGYRPTSPPDERGALPMERALG